MRPSLRRPLVAVFAGIAALVAAATAVIVTNTAQAADPRDSFVTRCGIRFCVDGKPAYFAGTNTYDLFTYGYDWLPGEQYVDKTRIDNHMANLRADGVQVLRLWMFSHEDWMGSEAAEGVYTEEEFILYDYIMKSARDHSIRLIPVFENYWEAYGGIDKRLSWEGLGTGQANRWRFFNKAQCPGCFDQYKNYVRYALARTNFFTGVKWINDPTVMAWELMNEPRYQDATPNENTTGTTLRAWVDEMGALVKSLDPNHLLGTGMEGQQTSYGYGGDAGNPFVYIHSSPYIDFTSAHMYPTEELGGPRLRQGPHPGQALDRRLAQVVGKPFFLGEWNVHDNKSEWWAQIYAEMEASGGDADAFWWFPGSSSCGGFDSGFGCPEHTVFKQHSANFAAKSGTGSTAGPTSSVPTSTRAATSTPPTSSVVTTRPPTSAVVTSRPPTSAVVTSRPPTSAVVTSRSAHLGRRDHPAADQRGGHLRRPRPRRRLRRRVQGGQPVDGRLPG
ncbi:cellulase family glycosylhydrolase [Luedemannella flava]